MPNRYLEAMNNTGVRALARAKRACRQSTGLKWVKLKSIPLEEIYSGTLECGVLFRLKADNFEYLDRRSSLNENASLSSMEIA